MSNLQALLRGETWKGFLIHLFLVLLVVTGAVFILFAVYLPTTTNHQDTAFLPDLKGKSLEQAKNDLEALKLNYLIYDSSAQMYDPTYPPYTVLDQNPAPQEKVKERRTVYLTINPVNPPLIDIPNILDLSVRNALILLKNNGLKFGKVIYVDDIVANTVLGVQVEGVNISTEQLELGYKVYKGSSISLKVGNGRHSFLVRVPDVVGLDFDIAERQLIGGGLKVGAIDLVTVDTLQAGTVVRQSPKATSSRVTNLGSAVRLTVVSGSAMEELVHDRALQGQ